MAYTIDDLRKRLEKLPGDIGARLPGALETGAALAVTALKGEIEAQGLVDTKQLRDSIKPGDIKGRFGEQYIEIWPQGTRERVYRTPRADEKRRGGKHNYQSGQHQTNAEVGAILEYGGVDTRRNPAYHWLENAVETAAKEILDAVEEELLGHIDL